MEDIETAESMINYYTERPPKIKNRTIYMQFSKHDAIQVQSQKVSW